MTMHDGHVLLTQRVAALLMTLSFSKTLALLDQQPCSAPAWSVLEGLEGP